MRNDWPSVPSQPFLSRLFSGRIDIADADIAGMHLGDGGKAWMKVGRSVFGDGRRSIEITGCMVGAHRLQHDLQGRHAGGRSRASEFLGPLGFCARWPSGAEALPTTHYRRPAIALASGETSGGDDVLLLAGRAARRVASVVAPYAFLIRLAAETGVLGE